MSVFISGSRSIQALPPEALGRLQTIIGLNMPVLVGDANGVDKLVQAYLKTIEYANVIVYSTGRPRNNLAPWPNTVVTSKSARGSRAYFTAKDIQMSKDCNYGMVIWDGHSAGSQQNIARLERLGKKFRVIYP